MPPQVSADGRTANVPLVLATAPFAPESLDLVAGPLRGPPRRPARAS
jgi:hypothetical protein